MCKMIRYLQIYYLDAVKYVKFLVCHHIGAEFFLPGFVITEWVLDMKGVPTFSSSLIKDKTRFIDLFV